VAKLHNGRELVQSLLVFLVFRRGHLMIEAGRIETA
jgi:hypothetical protein